jgi:microsomal dipeptidase-like Zn-dependent dipeptidase
MTPEMILERRHSYPEIFPKAAIEFEDELIQSGRDKIHPYEIYVPWLKSVSELKIITEALLARGYSAQDIEKILGGNFLRVFEKVWGN